MISAYNMTGPLSLSLDTFRNNSAVLQGGIVAVTGSPTGSVAFNNDTVAGNMVRMLDFAYLPCVLRCSGVRLRMCCA